MKPIYLLAGMLLLTPLASQAKKVTEVTGKAVVEKLQAEPPLPCQGSACAKRPETTSETVIKPGSKRAQKVFGNTGLFQNVVEALKGLSEPVKAWAKPLLDKVVVVAHKCVTFVGGRSAGAQEQNIVSREGMTSALQNAVLESPKWRDPVAKGNLEKFMNALYTGEILQVVEDVWGIDNEEEAHNKLAEIERNCALPAPAI